MLSVGKIVGGVGCLLATLEQLQRIKMRLGVKCVYVRVCVCVVGFCGLESGISTLRLCDSGLWYSGLGPPTGKRGVYLIRFMPERVAHYSYVLSVGYDV